MPSPFEERPEEHDGERPETPAKGAFKQQGRGGGRGKVQSRVGRGEETPGMPRTCKELLRTEREGERSAGSLGW